MVAGFQVSVGPRSRYGNGSESGKGNGSGSRIGNVIGSRTVVGSAAGVGT